MEKKKILLVDDEENFLRLVRLNLEATNNYEVKTENKGKSVLAVAKDFKPDLIFLDIMMSDIGGYEAAQQIKNDVSTKDIPIVFLTAVAEKEKIASWGKYYLPGYSILAKPVTVRELINTIEAIIRK